VKWMPFATDDRYGVVDLNKAMGAFSGVAGYAATEFFCDEERTVELRLEPLPLTGSGKIMKSSLRDEKWRGFARSVN